MIAAGMDIGGTKIEAQIFDANWQQVARHRAETPDGYPEFLGAIADMAKWVEAQAGRIPIGLGSAGLVSPETGMAPDRESARDRTSPGRRRGGKGRT